jgi:hypothetical protein
MTFDDAKDDLASKQGEHWHGWFAWHPALITDGEGAGSWVWLRHVDRRDFEIGWGCSHHQKRLSSPSQIARLQGGAA